MASVATEPGGRRRILFEAPDGKRKTLRLGKVSKRAADGVKDRVEQLLESLVFKRAMPADLAEWVAALPAKLANRMARVGLIPKPGERPAALTLNEHLADFFARRTDVKASTLAQWELAKGNLLAYFDATRPLASITAGEAADFARWLATAAARENDYAGATEGLAVNTARKRVRLAKQFFADAVEHEKLARNPFAKLNGTVRGNRARDYFVTREEADKVLAQCPDDEWKLLLALARFGGLRCPSEVLALKWDDVNWAENRMLVRSPKTEHHEGKESRLVPLFAELRPYLDAVWFGPDESHGEHVITRYRDPGVNLRTQLCRIVKRAGLKPWPKLWQNLRATRATELANEFPGHVAAAWLGHSERIADEHYRQVTSEHFELATTPKKAAQNPAQSMHEMPCRESHEAGGAREKPLEFPATANFGQVPPYYPVGAEGLEPPTSAL